MSAARSRRFDLAVLRAATVVLALGGTLAASTPAETESRIEGRILDAEGNAVAGCRVIAEGREASGVFVSGPSGGDGGYVLALPAGALYDIVALVTASGRRVEIEHEPIDVGYESLKQDLVLPVQLAPGPRRRADSRESVDRLFLGFVEDPAPTVRYYGELRIDVENFEDFDVQRLSAIGAAQFVSLPGVEVGARIAYGSFDVAGLDDDSGLTDTDAWAKLHVLSSPDARFDLGTGVLVRLPTGDSDAGQGADAFQAKWFVSAAYAVRSAVVLGHVGVRTTEDGEFLGQPLGGHVGLAGGVGALVPFSPHLSLTFEASVDDGRFDDTATDSRFLFGVNWRTGGRGTLRAAAGSGLSEASPDFLFTVGYARTFGAGASTRAESP